jgi:deoxyribose-phosphate aldolase
LSVKLADVADAVAAGADEIDMVIDRGAFLAGRYGQVYEEVRAVKEACGTAHLKVILETGELSTLDNVSRASWLSMLAGADFIKTSTGKVSPASTPPVALVMLSAVRDFEHASGRRVGVKVAGGIRTAKDAIRYLVLVNETAGPAWLTPDLFRIGASSLLNDLLMQRREAAHRPVLRPRLLHRRLTAVAHHVVQDVSGSAPGRASWPVRYAPALGPGAPATRRARMRNMTAGGGLG